MERKWNLWLRTNSSNLHLCDLLYPERENMSPGRLALLLSINSFRSLPVSPLLLKRERKHFTPCSYLPRLPQSIHIPWLLSSLLSSPRSVLSDQSGSIPLSRRAANSRKQTDGRTERDGDCLGGFSNSVSSSDSIPSNLHVFLDWSLQLSILLFLFLSH